MHQNATHDTTSMLAPYCQGTPKHIGEKYFKEHVSGSSQEVELISLWGSRMMPWQKRLASFYMTVLKLFQKVQTANPINLQTQGWVRILNVNVNINQSDQIVIFILMELHHTSGITHFHL